MLLITTAWSVHAANNRQYLTALQLKQWVEDGRDLEIIDIRGKQAYQAGSLPGAVNAGIDPKGYLPAVHSAPIVLIIPIELSETAVQQWIQRLQNVDHQLWILSGGVDAWIAAGEPLVIPDSFYTQPGTVPFLIPKGLCEQGESSQVFE